MVCLTSLLLLGAVTLQYLPLQAGASRLPTILWHGLGDRFDSPGLVALADGLRHASDGSETFVYIVRTSHDPNVDQRSTLFGNMTAQLQAFADDIRKIDALKDGFNAVGLSQGGVFLRAFVERYNLAGHGYPVLRTLVTMGSPHMGISSAPPCHPTDLFCRSVQWALRAVWTPYAQSSIVPAQYFRNQAKIEDYLSHSSFLRDINNERMNDTQPVSGAAVLDEGTMSGNRDDTARNATYKRAIAALDNLVLIAFDQDMTVIPFTSPLFTLPSATDPKEALPYEDLPLYAEDYIGLKELDRRGGLHQDTCHGQHMEIDADCWKRVLKWLAQPSKAASLQQQPFHVQQPSLP